MQSKRVVWAGGAAVALAAGAFWFGGDERAYAADTGVRIEGFAFAPANVSIEAGDTVTWTHNDGDIPHTVAFTGGPSSPVLTQGGVYLRTFDSAGTYGYICGVHPSMTGTVTVAAAQAPTATATTAPPTAVPATNTSVPPTATSTATAAATATEAATATLTAEAATATPAEGGSASPSAVASSAASSTPTAGTTPLAPDSGDDDGDGRGSALPIVIGGTAVVLLGAGAGVMLWRRNAG